MAKQNDKKKRVTDEFANIPTGGLHENATSTPYTQSADLDSIDSNDNNYILDNKDTNPREQRAGMRPPEHLLPPKVDFGFMVDSTSPLVVKQTPDSLSAVKDQPQGDDLAAWFQTMASRSRDLIQVFKLGPSGHLIAAFVSEGIRFVLGYEPHECKHLNDYIHPDDISYAQAVFRNSPNPAAPALLEYRARHKDGTWRHLESYVVNCLDDAVIEGFLMTTRDVTESRDREAHLLNRIAWFAALSNQTTDALRVVHVDGSVQVASGRLSWLFGANTNGMNLEALIQRTHPDDQKQVQDGITHALETPNARIRLGFRARDPLNEWRYVELEMLNCLEDSLIRGVILTGRDLTERKLFDTATRLPNRTLFLDRVERLLHRRQHTPDEEFAVLVAEIDRYKEVTDGLGTAVGERLLKTISSRLVVSVRPADFVGRLDRDKFTILLHSIRDPNDVARICQRIHESVEQPCFLGGHRVFTTITLGAALSTSSFTSASDMLHAAETAMHRGKASGGSTTELFDPTMGEAVRERLEIEGAMRHAIERREFRLHYQPIVSLDNFLPAGFEALCRWQRPNGDHVSPGLFIPIAEDTGMINPLGEWIMAAACKSAKSWEKTGKHPMFISVNLSGRQLARPEIVDEIRRILDTSGLLPQQLKLEVTETSLITNTELVAKTLHDLRSLGVRLALDDFGTGYSSLSYLHRFPFNTIKIDMSFVAMLGKDNEGAAIVPTIIQLAQSLGMDVIAEGIETPEQARLLIEMGCIYGQGYLFSRGLPESDLAALFAKGSLHP